MVNRLFKSIAILMLSCILFGCSIPGKIAPLFVPKSSHDKFFDEVHFLEHNGVQVVMLGDTIRMIIPGDYFFYPDSAVFKKEKAPVLWTVANILKVCGNAPVKVNGHSDDIGSLDHKFKLSYDRAFVIASYMWESGVPWRRMVVRGYADRWDTASYNTVSGSHFNRRVEVIMD